MNCEVTIKCKYTCQLCYVAYFRRNQHLGLIWLEDLTVQIKIINKQAPRINTVNIGSKLNTGDEIHLKTNINNRLFYSS